MFYIEPEQLGTVFEVIEQNYARIEEVPDYRLQLAGMERLIGVLTGVRMDTYYPTTLDKAAYLLLQINEGHFFSNGNKRLALVITGIFLALNGLRFQDTTKEFYKTALVSLFPEYEKFEDYPEFKGVDFATYNLSIIIAESGKLSIPFDILKERVKTFLQSVTELV
jgi:prophage maintenance system killer protein